MGGLAGGLYEFFNFIGELFFTFLIGQARAQRPQLEPNRVIVGGALTFVPIFCILFLIQREDWFVTSKSEPFSPIAVIGIGVVAGILAGSLIAVVLLGYVVAIKIEAEKEQKAIEKEAEERRKHAEKQAEEANERRVREVRKKKYRDELIAKGADPIEAEYEAEQKFKYPESSCFIATAVFGSSDSLEVIVLRNWRDEFLLTFSAGRIFVRIYYLISPYLVGPIKYCLPIKKTVKAILEYLVYRIASFQQVDRQK